MTPEEFKDILTLTEHPRLNAPPQIVNVRPIYLEVHEERLRAHKKHGARGNSREDAKWNDPEWLPILVEEIGEVAHWFTYDTEKAIEDLRDELIQVAAMAIAWAESIEEVRNNPD